MSPLSEVTLVTWREVRKNFRSAKGAALAAISLLGGGAVSMLFTWMERMARERLPPGVDLRDLRLQYFSAWYKQPATGESLADCPYALWMMLIATLWLAPLLVALMSFDAVSGDLQRGTVRFWVTRVRRSSCIIGKALGAWFAVLAVTLAMNVIVWTRAAAVGPDSVSHIIGWGLRFFAVVIPVTAAWSAIAVLIGSQMKTPMLALLTICASFFGLWVVHVSALVTRHDWLSWVYPSAYDALFLSPDPADIARGLLGTGLIAVLCLTAAALAFERRDL